MRADEPDRLLQLANQLADLFDQYQNYRPDWLEAWARGQDQLFVVAGGVQALPPEQQWQAALWRALLQGLSPAQQQGIRPRLHQRVLARLASAQPPAEALAPRVIAFGMSQVAWTTLELLAALAPHSQVVLAIPNPCRFYWGDIMDGRELLHSLRRRQALRPGRDLATLALEDMHTEANPLLAAWGAKGATSSDSSMCSTMRRPAVKGLGSSASICLTRLKKLPTPRCSSRCKTASVT